MRYDEFKLIEKAAPTADTPKAPVAYSDTERLIYRALGMDSPNGKASGNAQGAAPNTAYSTTGPGVGETGNAKDAIAFFRSKGWTPAQAAGIVGNLQAESGANLQTNAIGDGGKAYGIAQWHPPRQAHFKRAFGKDIRKAGFREQLEFVQWELENTESKAAIHLKNAKTPQDAAAVFDQYYERSSGAHRAKRIANAQSLMSTTRTV